jgi:hypothetical protein
MDEMILALVAKFEAEGRLNELLLDPNPKIREAAQFYLFETQRASDFGVS